MVGARDDDFASAKSISEVVGRTVVHLGPNGAGHC